ncbi:MAG: HAD family hydrolase [Myxococcales bacterium]|nr:HAD family hydrolase [Myxococcales bacterium]
MALTAAVWQIAGFRSAAVGITGWGAGRIRIASAIAMLNFMRVAAAHGILIKDMRAAEAVADVDVVLLDKTGTLTGDDLTVERITPFGDLTEREVLHLATRAEARWSHPIARAIVRQARAEGFEPSRADDGEFDVGRGVQSQLDGQRVLVGSRAFVESGRRPQHHARPVRHVARRKSGLRRAVAGRGQGRAVHGRWHQRRRRLAPGQRRHLDERGHLGGHRVGADRIPQARPDVGRAALQDRRRPARKR